MGTKYLYPRPPEDVRIFHSGWGSIVVREEVFRRLNAKRWPRMDVDELPVVDEPKDSLGILE
jgi:hypothetical protein